MRASMLSRIRPGPGRLISGHHPFPSKLLEPNSYGQTRRKWWLQRFNLVDEICTNIRCNDHKYVYDGKEDRYLHHGPVLLDEVLLMSW